MLEANPTVLGLLTFLRLIATPWVRRDDPTPRRMCANDRAVRTGRFWYSSRVRLVEPARVDTSSRRLPNCSLVKDPNRGTRVPIFPGIKLPGTASQATPRPCLPAWGRASYRRLTFCQGRSLPLWTTFFGELNRMAEPAIGGARIRGTLCHSPISKSSRL